MGSTERRSTACAVRDRQSQSGRRLQDQEDLQEISEDERERAFTQAYGVIRHENVVKLLEFLGYRQK